MANTFTTNYSWTKPEVGADTDAWGTHLNANLDSIDSTVKAISNVANAALPVAGGTMTGALLAAVGSAGAPSLSFTGDTNTGRYWVGADSFADVCGGSAVLTYAAGGVTANGTLTATGAATFNSTIAANGKVTGTAGTTGAATFNVPHGVAPTSPVNGDEWSTTTRFFHRVNGTTRGVAYSDELSGSIATATIVGNNTGSTGAPVALTAAQTKTLLAIANTDVSGLGTASTVNTGTSGATLGLLNGNLTFSGTNTHSGAETFSNGMTISAGAVLSGLAATPAAKEIGYLGLPMNSQSGDYTMTNGDRGGCIHFTASATLTIPANGTLALPIGSAWEVSADAGVTVTINYTTDTLRLVPTNSTGSRTLTGPGSAFLEKKKSTEIWIKGDVT